jgi:hypothetical protein
MYAFVAGLLLAAALAIAPGLGAFVHPLQGPVPAAATSPSAIPSRAPVSHEPTPVAAKPTPAGHEPSGSTVPGPRAVALDLVDRYEADLVAGRWSAAFGLLAPTSLTFEAGLDAFASERAAFFDSVDGRYTLGSPVRVRDWSGYESLVSGAVRSRAWLIEVDYPALSNNNAGYEQFVVAPDTTGTWRIWPVR